MSDQTGVNVLLVVPWDQESGGVASVVGNLARHLERTGHRVTFLYPGNSEVLRPKKTKLGFDGFELNLRTPFIPGRMPRSIVAFLLTFPFTFAQLLRLLWSQKIRLINIHYPGDAFIYFAFCRWILPLRLVISIHGSDVLPWNVPRRRLSLAVSALLRTADLIVSPSWGFLRDCTRVLEPFSTRRVAIHNGIDFTELGVPACDSEELEDPFVLSVATHDEWKALDVLIKAIALLRDRGQNVRLIQAGDGPLRPHLERLAASLHLQRQIQFLGWQSRESIAGLLRRCAMVVIPSRTESLGVAIMEALACGKPVIATPVGGIPELVQDGMNGILIEQDNPEALADAIAKLLGDATLRNRLGANGRVYVAERFQWQQMGERYIHAYAEVLERGA